MRNSTIVATILIFIPAYYLVLPILGNHGLWLAMTLFMLARGISLSIMAGKHIYEKIDQESA
jgi:MATE family multidrug resistance protein